MGNPSLSWSVVGKGGFPRSLQRDSWAPDNYSYHTLKTACWIILKSPNLRSLGEVPPGLKDLLKARFASHSPDISAGSLWSKALKGPYRGTMSGQPGSLRIAIIIGKQNKGWWRALWIPRHSPSHGTYFGQAASACIFEEGTQNTSTVNHEGQKMLVEIHYHLPPDKSLMEVVTK